MQIEPIESAHALSCPHCGMPAAYAGPRGTDPATAAPWLTDGDAVPKIPEAPEGFALEAMLSIGECAACRGGYYVVEAFVTRAPKVVLYDWLAGSLDLEGESQQLVRAGAAPAWVRRRAILADGGYVDEHLFGPYPVALEQLRGPLGVAACGEAAQAPAWSAARQLVADRLDALLAAAA